MNNTFWQDKSIFVTGCTGLLGSWLCADLVKTGAQVVGLVRDDVPRSQLFSSGAADQMNIVRGDIVNYPLLERALAEYEVDTIFHLAAQTIVSIANRAPVPTFETNVRGTWLLLEAARQNGAVKRVVVASSDKAYGDQPQLPYREDSPLQGKHPYDVSKSCADLIAQTYAHSYGLPVAVTRCANLYGGGDLNWNRIVPGTIRSVLSGERPIIRSDGAFIRDYIYIPDAAKGYMMTAEKLPAADVTGHGFNFGQNQPVSVLDLVQTITHLAGNHALEPIILNEASNEIREQYLCADKAGETLGWEPNYSLEAGLKETIAWYKNFLLSGEN